MLGAGEIRYFKKKRLLKAFFIYADTYIVECSTKIREIV